MDDKYLNKYRIPSARLSNWDYGAHGLYFVTICTKDRLLYFGDVVSEPNVETVFERGPETQNIASLRRTLIGDIAYQNWINIPSHFSFIELYDFVIMPNHVHGVLLINRPDKQFWEKNKFGSQSQNLASVIRGYKASVKTYATKNNIEFNWQPRYHDRVIQSEKEYLNIKEYIFNNPEQWLLNGDTADNFRPT